MRVREPGMISSSEVHLQSSGCATCFAISLTAGAYPDVDSRPMSLEKWLKVEGNQSNFISPTISSFVEGMIGMMKYKQW